MHIGVHFSLFVYLFFKLSSLHTSLQTSSQQKMSFVRKSTIVSRLVLHTNPHQNECHHSTYSIYKLANASTAALTLIWVVQHICRTGCILLFSAVNQFQVAVTAGHTTINSSPVIRGGEGPHYFNNNFSILLFTVKPFQRSNIVDNCQE